MVKTQFSIKDLENLSGVKAHTIRIWEKRYDLLQPLRTDTNIRQYDIDNLKRLLNVTALYNQGHKISKIAGLDNPELQNLVVEEVTDTKFMLSIQQLKTAVLEFDSTLFSQWYNQLRQVHSFSEVFEKIFIPLLKEIGYLWQAGTIDPAHERFISELIKQKLAINIDEAHNNFKRVNDVCFSLFLPSNEIHEIGLLYAHYLLVSSNLKSIYLGSNIPLSSLENVLRHHDNVTFVAYSTVEPEADKLHDYFSEFLQTIRSAKDCNLWVLGQRAHEPMLENFSKHILQVKSLEAFKNKIREFTK